MKLTKKFFTFADESGKRVKLSADGKITIDINGEKLSIDGIIHKPEIKSNGLSGFSILQYFKLKDGYLTSENLVVKFIIQDRFVKIDEIETITDWADFDIKEEVSMNYILDSTKLFKIKEPLKLFRKNLSEKEKEEIEASAKAEAEASAKAEAEASAKAEAETSAKAEAEASASAKAKAEASASAKAKAEASAKATEDEKADEKLKASISQDYIINEDEYRELQEDYSNSNGKEYKSNDEKYFIFHSPDSQEILYKAGKNWFESVAFDFTWEKDKQIKFCTESEIDGEKVINLNLETGEVIVKDEESENE